MFGQMHHRCTPPPQLFMFFSLNPLLHLLVILRQQILQNVIRAIHIPVDFGHLAVVIKLKLGKLLSIKEQTTKMLVHLIMDLRDLLESLLSFHQGLLKLFALFPDLTYGLVQYV